MAKEEEGASPWQKRMRKGYSSTDLLLIGSRLRKILGQRLLEQEESVSLGGKSHPLSAGMEYELLSAPGRSRSGTHCYHYFQTQYYINCRITGEWNSCQQLPEFSVRSHSCRGPTCEGTYQSHWAHLAGGWLFPVETGACFVCTGWYWKEKLPEQYNSQNKRRLSTGTIISMCKSSY